MTLIHTTSYGPVPIHSNWSPYVFGGSHREKAGWWSLIRWHCFCPMRRVLSYEIRGSIVTSVLEGWICPACQHRKYRPLMK